MACLATNKRRELTSCTKKDSKQFISQLLCIYVTQRNLYDVMGLDDPMFRKTFRPIPIHQLHVIMLH